MPDTVKRSGLSAMTSSAWVPMEPVDPRIRTREGAVGLGVFTAPILSRLARARPQVVIFAIILRFAPERVGSVPESDMVMQE